MWGFSKHSSDIVWVQYTSNAFPFTFTEINLRSCPFKISEEVEPVHEIKRPIKIMSKMLLEKGQEEIGPNNLVIHPKSQ